MPMLVSLIMAFTGLSYTCTAASLPLIPSPLLGSSQLPTSSGYLPLEKDGKSLFFAFYEAAQTNPSAQTPIVLWLQGGPGCASNFGNFYELGPWVLTEEGKLMKNTYSWNAKAGLLFIDQPAGTGFSISERDKIPTNEMEMAEDLYDALQAFFRARPRLQQRPFFITGESYAGKYVPSIGHFVLQMQQNASHSLQQGRLPLQYARPVRHSSEAPLFKLSGLAIGDGLTDPLTQMRTHADTAFYMGVIDQRQRRHAKRLERHVAQLIKQERWEAAHSRREKLLQYIQECSGVATLYDVRRRTNYDAANHVDQLLNNPDVKDALRAQKNITFVGCSPVVAQALGPDVMKSVKYLLPDILERLPVLLYQGQFDLQDGVATSETWIDALKWPGRSAFQHAQRHVWRLPISTAADAAGQGGLPWLGSGGTAIIARWLWPGSSSSEAANADVVAGGHLPVADRVAGYWKAAGPLTQVVITNAGHMLPRDQGDAAQRMLQRWIGSVLMNESLPATS